MSVRRLRLSHPDLPFDIDATLSEHEGRWLATVTMADESAIGTGSDPREALRDALKALGDPVAWDLADGAEPEA